MTGLFRTRLARTTTEQQRFLAAMAAAATGRWNEPRSPPSSVCQPLR